jgi:hypothetical protein
VPGAAHRTGSYNDYPVPGTYDHNWNGHVTGLDLKDLLVDPLGSSGARDFRPKEGSSLVDAGFHVPGVTDGFVGAAPDIGAYEKGGEQWTAGLSWDVSAWNISFVPPSHAESAPAVVWGHIWTAAELGGATYAGASAPDGGLIGIVVVAGVVVVAGLAFLAFHPRGRQLRSGWRARYGAGAAGQPDAKAPPACESFGNGRN